MPSTPRLPELAPALVVAVEAGFALTDACDRVGVSHNTVRGWVKRGHREQDTLYAQVAADLGAARERSELAPMDEAELFRHVAKAVRRGSVQAMRLYWEMLRERDEQPTDLADDPFAAFDDLARVVGATPTDGPTRDGGGVFAELAFTAPASGSREKDVGHWRGAVTDRLLTPTLPRVALTRAEAAAALGMSVDSFERYVQADVRLIRRGKLRLVPVTELERWADENAERALG